MIAILKKVNQRNRSHKSVKTEQKKPFSTLIQEAEDNKPNKDGDNCSMITN